MNITFIWDVDGTLLNSYPIMIKALLKLCNEYNHKISEEKLLLFVKEKSINEFIQFLSDKFKIDFKILLKEFKNIENEYVHDTLTLNAKEILIILSKNNIKNFVYTHRDKSTFKILEKCKIAEYFDEVVTSENGFERKPDKAALDYLIDKYGLDKNNTYYVGDRKLDVECAKNAGIKSILLSENNIDNLYGEDFKINNLLEIKNIVSSDLTFNIRDQIFNVRVSAVIKRGKKILIAKRKGYFSFIGGRCKINETFIHAIKREIKEELNCDCNIIKEYDILEIFYKNVHELNKVFLVEINNEVLDNEFYWVNIRNLSNFYILPIDILDLVHKDLYL